MHSRCHGRLYLSGLCAAGQQRAPPSGRTVGKASATGRSALWPVRSLAVVAPPMLPAGRAKRPVHFVAVAELAIPLAAAPRPETTRPGAQAIQVLLACDSAPSLGAAPRAAAASSAFAARSGPRKGLVEKPDTAARGHDPGYPARTAAWPRAQARTKGGDDGRRSVSRGARSSLRTTFLYPRRGLSGCDSEV